MDLNQINDALDQAIKTEERNKKFIENIGPALVKALEPAIKEALSNINVNINPEVTIPPMQSPDVHVAAPIVNVPEPIVNVTVPPIKVPKSDVKVSMPTKALTNEIRKVTEAINAQPLPVFNTPTYTFSKPIPSIIVDAKGKPMDFGGGSRTLSLTRFMDSDNNPIDVSAANPLPISGTLSTSPFATYYASDAVASQNLIQVGGNAVVVGTGYQDNALRVVNATDAVTSVFVNGFTSSVGATILNGDGTTRNSWLVSDITNSIKAALVDSSGVQYSGSNPLPITGPVVVTSITNTIAAMNVDSTGVGYSGSNPLPITGTVTVGSSTNTTGANIIDSSGVAYSGSNPVPVSAAQSGTWNIGTVTTVTGITNTIAAMNVDSTGVGYSGSNPLPISGPVTQSGTWNIGTVTGVTNSLQATIIDSSGVGYSGSNPLPISGSVTVSGSVTSTVVVGDTVADAADSGSAPIKIGGVARTTNPTAVADGDRVSATYDKIGRGLTRPLQVRDLVATAYVSVANGTETTLLAAGGSGVFHDCVMLTATNNSSVATQLDIRATTGGNIIHTMYLPAQSGPVGWAPAIPWPQDNVNNNWTIDMPDQTGTTVYVSGLFIKEI